MAYRRYSYSGGPLAPLLAPPPVPTAAPAAALPFPGMQPRQLLTPPAGNPLQPDGQPAGLYTPTAAPPPASPAAEAAPVATADEEALQSMLSALRVALAKKEAALVSVAGQLAEMQARLEASDAERQHLAAQLREAAPLLPDAAAAAVSETPGEQLLASARAEAAQQAARAAQLAAERDSLAADVDLLRQQLTAAAQAEAQERERLCSEATQSRLLARARARQVEQLQAELARAASERSSAGAAAVQQAEAAASEAATAKAAAQEAAARAAAAEDKAARLQQALEASQETARQAEARQVLAAQAEKELGDARQQADWAALRIGELEQSSSVGQLLRKYEAEVQRLRAQHEEERRDLQQQLAAAQQQAAAADPAQQPASLAASLPAEQQQQQQQQQQQPSLDSAAWAALFDDPSQPGAPEVADAAVQADGGAAEQPPWVVGADPALLEAARLEIERLQDVNTELVASQSQAHQALEDALAQQRAACLARDREAAARQAAVEQQQLALDAARRSEAAARERLELAEQRLGHQGGEVAALRQANEKLELAVAALKEELAAGGQASQQQLEALRAELQRALAHTTSLEGQLQELKQAAAAAAEHHVAAAQQQAQDSALDAAEQVAAAVAAATARHEQQLAGLQAQLFEARQQLAAARDEVAAMQAQQAARAQGMVDQDVQAGCPLVAVQHAAVQTDVAAAAPILQPTTDPVTAATAAAAAAAAVPTSSSWQLGPSRGGSACESPAHGSGGGGLAEVAPSVALTATQLQLELARVKITPMKPLAAGGGRLLRTPSRLGSACRELGSSGCDPGQQQLVQPLQHQRSGSWGAPHGGGASSALGLRRQASGLTAGLLAVANVGGSSGQLAAEEEDGCWATPLAQTPASLSPRDPSPLIGLLSPAGSGSLDPGPAQQQQQQQQAVPPLDLGRVRPYSSLSCDSPPTSRRLGEGSLVPLPPASVGGSSWGAAAAAAEVSASVSSLSSLGPSVSQRGGPSWGPASSRGTPAADGVGFGGNGQDLPSSAGGISSSWQAASLDASLARLAALTAGLTGGRGKRRG